MPTTRYLSYRRRRRRKNLRLALLLILVLLAAGAATWVAVSSLSPASDASSVPEESAVSSLPAEESSLPESEPTVSEPPEVSGTAAVSDVSQDQVSEPEESSEYVTWVNFSLPVPEGKEMDDDYFDDAVFIGDSRTQGFILYSGLANATAYADKGLSVESAFTKESISVDGKKIPVMDALAANDSFKKVYLMLGVNELGWNYANIFQEKYQKVVQRIKEINPEAEIYVQSILPVSQAKSDGDKVYNNPRIQEYNQLIMEVAAEEEVYYLDVAEAVSDENGALPADASTDGVHLNKAYCQKWLAYLKNHTVEGIGQ